MEHEFATAKKEVLVDVVRLVQRQRLEGEKGGWKEFLKVYGYKMGLSDDKKKKMGLSDPSRHRRDVLVAFLKTFKNKEDLELLARVMQRVAYRDLIQKLKEESADETTEQRLVRLTVEHPTYLIDYAFASYTEDWFVTKTRKESNVINSMFAIDCEMVVCEDGSQAVIRVGVVDRYFKVVLNTFVKPDKAILDYKTEKTGITAEDVEKFTRSVTYVQEIMKRFLSQETILVGHSLHNDLKVLKIDHARVIDTSLVFNYANERNSRRPSLNNLCKSVLGHEVRIEGAVHNCVHDAEAAMRLVLAVVEKGVDTTIAQTVEMLEADKRRLEVENSKLFIHKIPNNVSSEELKGVITGEFTLNKRPRKRGGFNSAVMIFKSPEEAKQAFDNIHGLVLKDRMGLPQKLLEFRLSSGERASLYVRKTVQDNEISVKKRVETEESNENSKKRKRANTQENNESSKRQKREEDPEETKESNVNHLKEIDELKQKLKAQDKIIASLKKQLEKKQ